MGYRSTLHLLALVGLTGALLFESHARAQQAVAHPPPDANQAPALMPVPLTCTTIHADKTVLFPANAWSVRVDSATYGSPACDAFVADVEVTSAAAMVPEGAGRPLRFQTLHPTWQSAGPKDKASCESSSVTVDYYRKADGDSRFTRLFQWTPTLAWSPQRICTLSAEPDHLYVPPASGKDTYRVVVWYRKNGQQGGPISVGMRHVTAPPPKPDSASTK